MTITATAPVPRHLDLAAADTIQLTAPTLADQVRHLTARGLSVVEIATRLGVTAWTAFEAGAVIRQPGDVTAVGATAPPITTDEEAEHLAWAVSVAPYTMEEVAARYDVSMYLAGVMQDLAFETLARRARLLFDQGASAAHVAAQLGVSEIEAIDLSLDDIARETGWTAGIGLRPDPHSIEHGGQA